MKPQHTQTYGDPMKALLTRKIHSFECLQKETREAHTSSLTRHLKAKKKKKKKKKKELVV